MSHPIKMSWKRITKILNADILNGKAVSECINGCKEVEWNIAGNIHMHLMVYDKKYMDIWLTFKSHNSFFFLVNYLFRRILFLQNDNSTPVDDLHIWQVPPHSGCGETYQIWRWYPVVYKCSKISGNSGNWLSNTTPCRIYRSSVWHGDT